MSLPVVALGVALLGLLVLAAAGPVYRLGASLPTAFAFLRWGAYIGAAGAALAIATALLSYRRNRRKDLAVAIAALIAALVAVVIPLSWQRRAASVPPIHDITTDLDNPPEFRAVVPLRAEAPNSLERPDTLAALQREGYPDLAPVTLSMTADQAYDRVFALVQEKGWEIVSADKTSGRIEATDTTRFFGFKDDIVIRVTPWGSGARVDLRSVSRVGRSDVGTNARRIEDFLEDLE